MSCMCRPVFAQDKSGHHGVANSALLKLLKFDENTKNPDGEHSLIKYGLGAGNQKQQQPGPSRVGVMGEEWCEAAVAACLVTCREAETPLREGLGP